MCSKQPALGRYGGWSGIGAGQHSDSSAGRAEITAMEKDPVCGAELDAAAMETKIEHFGGKTYYFCSDACREEFLRQPEEFVR